MGSLNRQSENQTPTPADIPAFDALIEAQADTAQFELVESVIVMVTNPTETHEQIAGNIGAH